MKVDFDFARCAGDGFDLLRTVPDEFGNDIGGVAPESEADVFGFPSEERAEAMGEFLFYIKSARWKDGAGEAQCVAVVIALMSSEATV